MNRAARAVSALLVAALLALVLLGVACRYVLGRPLTWSDEAAAVLFVWMVFITAALAVPLREHVAFDLLVELLPPRAQRLVTIVASFAVALALVAALPKTLDYVAFLWRERTPALEWRLDYVYACFPLFLEAAALRFLAHAARLCLRRS